MVAAFWIDKVDREPTYMFQRWTGRSAHGPTPQRSAASTKNMSSNSRYRVLGECLIYLLLGLEMWAAYMPVRNDILLPYSSSADLAQFVDQHHEYRDAIIMGEPDFYMEALPYYLDNPIYFPREHRFGKVVSLTTINQQKLSLAELLATARQVKQSGKPVLIALGHRLSSDGKPVRIRFNYGKIFEYDQQSLQMFNQDTTKVADFQRALTNERYTLYEVR
jgi:hypothetical protein